MMIRITSEHQATVARLLAAEGLLDAGATIPRADGATRAPLSEHQLSLWLSLQGAAGSCGANVPLVFRICGSPVDVRALERALLTIVERHEVLRSLIVVEDEQPWQAPQPLDGLTLIEENVAAGRLDARIDELVNRPLDVRSRIPFEMRLLAVADDLSYLVILTHHIAFDGWSIGVLQQELQSAYFQLSCGRPPSLPQLDVRHLDFALWQASDAGAAARQRGLDYWKRLLHGANARLVWPDTRRWARAASQAGANCTRMLPDELAARLRRFAAEQRTTAFVVLISIYLEVLSRYCFQDDFCVGTAVSGRDRCELEKVIGCFVSTLLMRYRRAPQRSFVQLLHEMDAQLRRAREHQHVPFHAVMSVAEAGRGAFQPFTQAMFAYQTESSGTALGFECGGLRFEPYRYELRDARYDLLLTVLSKAGRLAVNFEYRTRIFAHDDVELLANAYLEMLEAVVSKPNTPLALLDRRRAVRDREAAQPDVCVSSTAALGTFEAVTRDRGVDWRFDGVNLADIIERARHVACRLQRTGIGPGDELIVACSEAQPQAVALYASLHCGARCIPADHDLSIDRMARLTDRLGGAVLLGTADVCARLDSVAVTKLQLEELLALHDADDGAAAGPVARDRFPLALSAITRVDFRGGNDIELTTFAAADILQALSAPAAPLQVLAGSATDSHVNVFDRAIGDLARVVRAAVGRRDGVAEISGIPLRIASSVSGVARRLDFGGPCAPREYLAETTSPFSYFLRIPESVAYNGTCHVQEGGVASIDVANAPHVGVAGRSSEHVAAGAAGELVIGGAGLAWGYADDSRKTAECFTPDARPGAPGARMFHTRQIVKRHGDGVLRHVGSEDTRVVRRGMVFDLTEIEAALNGHVGVLAARAEVAEIDAGADITAYVVLDASQPASVDDLRRFLKGRLPAGLVPTRFRTACDVPCAADLTIDRSAFADSAPPRRKDARLEKIEAILIEVWQKTLDKESVERGDNFFELGGDSILCLAAQARAQKRGVQFSVEDLFTHQTVAELAEYCRVGETVHTETGAFALLGESDRQLLPEDAEAAYPLSRLQAGMFYHSRLAPQAGIYHDVINYWLEGEVDARLLKECVQEVLSQADTCRSTFHIAGFSEPIQIVHRAHRVPFELSHHPNHDHAAAARLVEAWSGGELARGFDVKREVPIRCAIHQYSRSQCVLSYSFHHALLDGWSEAQITADVLRLYASRLCGARRERPERRIPYRQFIALERAAEADDRQRAFWEGYLKDLTPCSVPKIKDRPDERAAGAASIRIDERTSAALQRLAVRMKVSAKSLLLAVHCKVLEAITGSGDVVTGMAFNGRPEIAGGERALGLFLNTVPVRIEAGRHQRWRSLVEHCVEAEAQLAAFRRFPLPAIVSAGGGRRFDVLYNYTHFHNYGQIETGSPLAITARTGVSANSLAYAANFWTDPSDNRIYGAFTTPPDETAHGRQIATLFERAIASLTAAADDPAPELSHDYRAYRNRADAAPQTRSVVLATTGAATRGAHGGEPATDTEKVIASIWRDVLKLGAVDRDDDFYALGGDSLAAMRLIAELERIYEIDVPMATILQHPRLWQFCRALEDDDTSGSEISMSSRLLVEAYEARIRRDSRAADGAAS